MPKRSRKAFPVLSCVALVSLLAVGCSISFGPGSSSTAAAVTGLTLNKRSSAVFIGGTDKLIATITPSNATNQTVTWSSDSSAAIVSASGLVTGESVGTANITATTADGGYTAQCSVSIADPATITVTVN